MYLIPFDPIEKETVSSWGSGTSEQSSCAKGQGTAVRDDPDHGLRAGHIMGRAAPGRCKGLNVGLMKKRVTPSLRVRYTSRHCNEATRGSNKCRR